MVRAEGRVGRNDNASFVARGKDIFFKTRPNTPEDISSLYGSGFEELDTRMTLDLVHGRNYYIGELEQVPEISRRDVRDTCQWWTRSH